MKRSIVWIGLMAALLTAGATERALARGFGGGFRGGGGGGFRGGGGGFHGGGGGGFGGGGFHGGGNIGGGGFHGGGLSGGGFHPAPSSRPSVPHSPSFNRPSIQPGGGGGGINRPNVVHRPQQSFPGLNGGSRPQLRPGGGITRPDLNPGNRPNLRPGGEGRPGLPAGGGRPSTGLRPGGDTASLPGLGPSRPGAGGAGTRLPTIRPGEGGAGTRLPGDHPGAGGAGNRLPGNRPGAGGSGERLPGMRPGQGGAGERWTPGDRGTLPERHQDLVNRFNDLNNHWGDSNWAHQQWNGPNGGQINHVGFWGPNGYWGHTGAWGPNGGYWGHTGHVGPNGAWGHTGYFGPAGHWSRNWGWYNGYGPAWGNGRWNYLWNQYPVAMAFGATMWGLNAVNWMFGVGNYYNPYATSPVYVDNQQVINYSQPIVGDPAYDEYQSQDASTDATAASDDSSASDPLTETFDQARQAFYDEQFDQSLTLTNQALKLAPEDAAVNEFRSLCLFALGQYHDAAGTIHAVLAAGPGWDWTTLISLYSNPQTYTDQLRKLEAAVKENPQAADLRFLLAYHYLTDGHLDSAVQQWKKVVQLQPDDRLSAQLVQMYEPPKDEAATDQQSPPPDLEAPAYPLEKLEGNWTAHEGDSAFQLQLKKDDAFNWTFTRDGKSQSMTGVYAVRGNNLVMQPDSGGTMLSNITLKDDQTLEFAPINDGTKLTFTR